MFGGKSKEEKFIIESERREHTNRKDEGILASGLKEEQADIGRYPQMAQDVVLFTQDFEDEKIQTLINELKNKIKDGSGEWTSPKIIAGYGADGAPIFEDIPPIINDMGIMSIVSLAAPYFHKNMINSNYEQDKITFILDKTKKSLRKDLIINAPRYGLGNEPSTVQLHKIIDIFMNHIKPTIYRALNDGERKHLRSFTKKIEASMDLAQEKKKTFGW